MKIDTRYNSMWDNLPAKYEGRIPETQEELQDFYKASEASMHDSLMKAVDAHNESMRRSAELRKKTQRKQDIERRVIQHREEQHKLLEEEAVRRRRNAEIFA